MQAPKPNGSALLCTGIHLIALKDADYFQKTILILLKWHPEISEFPGIHIWYCTPLFKYTPDQWLCACALVSISAALRT